MKHLLALTPCVALFCITGCTNPASPEKRILTDEEYRLFDTNDSVIFKQGKDIPERRLFVFSRTDCPHCKHQAEEFLKFSDITVHSFLVVTEKNAKNTVDSWCSYRSMLNLKCDPDALRRNNALANRLNVSGTPTIIFPNHVMYSGFMTAQEIEKALTENQ